MTETPKSVPFYPDAICSAVRSLMDEVDALMTARSSDELKTTSNRLSLAHQVTRELRLEDGSVVRLHHNSREQLEDGTVPRLLEIQLKSPTDFTQTQPDGRAVVTVDRVLIRNFVQSAVPEITPPHYAGGETLRPGFSLEGRHRDSVTLYPFNATNPDEHSMRPAVLNRLRAQIVQFLRERISQQPTPVSAVRESVRESVHDWILPTMDSARLADQMQVLFQLEGVGLFELSILLERAFSDLLRMLDSSDYSGFFQAYLKYFPGGFSKRLVEAGFLLISDTLHTLNNTCLNEDAVAKNEERIYVCIQSMVDALGIYLRTQDEEAFWTRQNMKRELESGWAAFNTKDLSSLGDNAEVRAPANAVKSIMMNLVENANRVARHEDPLAKPNLLELRAVQDDGVVKCLVLDDLPPFPMRKLLYLFDKIVPNIESGDNRQGHGTGLIRIAQQMERIGGEIALFQRMDERWFKKMRRSRVDPIHDISMHVPDIPEGATKCFVLYFPTLGFSGDLEDDDRGPKPTPLPNGNLRPR